MRRLISFTAFTGVTLTFALLCLAPAHAKKPTEPPGGGGGGTGEDETVLYDVLEIPLDRPGAMSEPNSGIVTMTGANNTGTGFPAAFVRIRESDQAIVASGFLPVPELTSDPTEIYSDAWSVNNNGIIVGRTGVKGASPNIQVAVAWYVEGTAYQLQELPTLSGTDSDATAVNNVGEIVGASGGRAVYWDPLTGNVHDLNTVDTAAQGWDFLYANDINDAGQIVGLGRLHGLLRGFLIDADGQIYPVPLLGPAIGNGAFKIDELGGCVGWGWDANDVSKAYFWNGPGTDAVLLPSLDGTDSLASEVNELGQIVGRSGVSFNDTLATLWNIDASGQVATTDLNSVIESKWTLLRGADCNNLGWISVEGKRSYRGTYRKSTLLLIPRQ